MLYTRDYGKVRLLALLALASVFVFFFRLGALPLYDYDEAHYAQVVQHTLQSGDVLTLQRSGDAWFEKPPLLLWLTMGSAAVFGKSEFAMRFPSALFGIAAIFGAYALTFQLTGNFYAALASGFILLSSGIFPAAARQLRMDVPLAAVMILAVYGFVRGWDSKSWYLVFWLCAALGFLLKSTPALLVLPTALIFSAVHRQWGWARSGYFWLGAPLFFVISAPWHIYEYVTLGSRFLDGYSGFHVWRRTAEKVLGGGVTNWDYLWHFFVLNEPWFLLGFVLCALLLFYRHKRILGSDGALASFLSVLAIFSAFAVAKTKLVFYLIPMFPFQAVAIACAGLFVFRNAEWRDKRKIFLAAGSIAFLAAGVSTALQIFYFRAPYAYSFADDERAIGVLIRESGKEQRIYAFDWKAYDTIYYYGGVKDIVPVSQEELARGFPVPYYLIFPRAYLPAGGQPGTTVRFTGKYLALVEVHAGNK